LIAASLFAFAATTLAPIFMASSNEAEAQSAADRRTQPGSGQCRLASGHKC
jgi:type II secretory pathway pseudopilin PulG